MNLMTAVRTHQVPPQATTLWWLGQAGYLMKSPGGATLALDPYLTNSCAESARRVGIDAERRFPTLVQPEELDVDAILLTHSHQDHCDPETIARLRRSQQRPRFIAPGETHDKLLCLQVPEEEIWLTWPNRTHRLGDFLIKATFAIPYAADDLTHVGYLVLIDDGPRIYFTGDTDYHDILSCVAESAPTVMVTVINGAFRNLGPNEATKLAIRINPQIVIPCHYDLFPDNSLDPKLFHANLRACGIGDKYRQLEHGQPFICFADASKSI